MTTVDTAPEEHEHRLAWAPASYAIVPSQRLGPVRVDGSVVVTATSGEHSYEEVRLRVEEAMDDHGCDVARPLSTFLADLLPHLRMAPSGEELFIDPAHLRALLEGRA